MPCRQVSTYNGATGSGQAGGGGYATESDCLQACKEGACCENGTCSVKPQCQCQGTGQTFKGVGTTCSPNPCRVCDIQSISISSTGTASAFYALSGPTHQCANDSFSVDCTGAGSLIGNNGFASIANFCPEYSSGSGLCAYLGEYALSSNARIVVTLAFFRVGGQVRYAIVADVQSRSLLAVSACSPSPANATVIGATGAVRGCSGTIATVDDSGGFTVDLASLPPLHITQSRDQSTAFAGASCSVSFSFNPLP